MESELSSYTAMMKVVDSVEASVDALIDPDSVGVAIDIQSHTMESPSLQLCRSNATVINEVENRLRQVDSRTEGKHVTWVELVHEGLYGNSDEDAQEKSGNKDAGNYGRSSTSPASSELEAYDGWIERIHAAAPSGTFMMIITQGSLLSVKMLAARKLHARWEQTALRKKQAIAGIS